MFKNIGLSLYNSLEWKGLIIAYTGCTDWISSVQLNSMQYISLCLNTTDVMKIKLLTVFIRVFSWIYNKDSVAADA
jgi:hypothetical protein